MEYLKLVLVAFVIGVGAPSFASCNDPKIDLKVPGSTLDSTKIQLGINTSGKSAMSWMPTSPSTTHSYFAINIGGMLLEKVAGVWMVGNRPLSGSQFAVTSIDGKLLGLVSLARDGSVLIQAVNNENAVTVQTPYLRIGINQMPEGEEISVVAYANGFPRGALYRQEDKNQEVKSTDLGRNSPAVNLLDGYLLSKACAPLEKLPDVTKERLTRTTAQR